MTATGATQVDEFAFRDVFFFVLPKKEDMRWASIPWQTDLWEARKIAAEADKPIFFWAMNGKPLCQIPT
jgi:hypothetical protein